MDEQAKLDLEELRNDGKARYADRHGFYAVIYADDINLCVKVKVFNHYGYQVFEQHFNYYGCENAVRSAKESLERYHPEMFRKI